VAEFLHIDFETRSTVDLRVAGLDNYADHPTTEAWCMAWRLGGEFGVWQPEAPLPERLRQHVEAGKPVAAHNAAFELAVWNRIMAPRRGWPPLALEQMRCTMAVAHAAGMPGALEKAAPAAGIDARKDWAGHRLMLQMCQPRAYAPDGQPLWWDDRERRDRLAAYCGRDCETEAELFHRLTPLSETERRVWALDRRINDRGVQIDLPVVQAAMQLYARELERLHGEMRRLTGGAVSACSEVAALGRWLAKQGVKIDALAKGVVLDALAGENLPAPARAALQLRQEAAKSSTAKLQAMLNGVSADGRLRGMFVYHRASTGRWGGFKVQLQNLPRPRIAPEEVDQVLWTMTHTKPAEAAEWLRAFLGPPLEVLSWCLRGMLTAAPGHDLLAADFANIEGRALAWLAGEDWKLDAYRAFDRKEGPDLYLLAYSRVRGVSITEAAPYRQVGKTMELALGYQGGLNAFRTMEVNLGLKLGLDDDAVRASRDGWRRINPAIARYWDDLETAARTAVLRPGGVFEAGARPVRFKRAGSFLLCRLPSGRVLSYPYPQVKPVETPWGEIRDQVIYMHVNGLTNKWEETHTYGGKLAENVTQAVCRDLLAHGMLEVERADYPVVLHAHDEAVAEIPARAKSLEEYSALFVELPPWAEGMPVVAEGWRGKRYRK